MKPLSLSQIDFNLLLDLDVLLREGSVARAARALHLSAPAMSRRLTRLRDALGDPLFVPAGRGLVPTQRALDLTERVREAIASVQGVFTPERVDFKRLRRTFTLRANDGFSGAWATRLASAIKREAPTVCLQFMPRADSNIEPLRSGAVDLDIGVAEPEEAEIHSDTLFQAPFVGVVQNKHPLLKKLRKDKVSLEDLVAWAHVSTAPQGQGGGRLDSALKKFGLHRRIAVIAPGFQAALVMVATSDLIAVMPEPFVRWAMKPLNLSIFSLPVTTSSVEVSQRWHARHHADPVHLWFRQHVQAVCAGESKGKS